MNRILVPTDFSQNSQKALQYAIQIAKAGGGEITVLHVAELSDSHFSIIKGIIDEQNRELQQEHWEKLHELQQRLLETENLSVNIKLYSGDIVEGILEQSKSNNADLIIMGTSETSSFRDKLIGNKATKLIRQSKIPVLCIPYHYNWSAPQHFLLAINAELKEAAVLQPLATLCQLFKASLKIAVLSEDNSEGVAVMAHSRAVMSVMQLVEKRYPDIDCTPVHLTGKHFYESILNYIQEAKIDLLAVIPHQKNWLDYITGKSITQKLAGHTQIPLLTIYEKMEKKSL